MKLPRRKFLCLAARAAAFPVVPPIARAQTYPSRPVRFMVGSPPGGQLDIIARLIGQWLSERLGQPIIVDNRPGAGTNLATEAVVRAPADGHMLLLASATAAINATLYDNLSSISLAILRRSPASTAFRSSWKCIRLFRLEPFPS
jgi:tripartite-type tricarboxylate transporter receptor subunit TctC